MKLNEQIDQIVDELVESPKREHDYAYNLFRFNLNQQTFSGKETDPEAIAKGIIDNMLSHYEIMPDVADSRGFLKTAIAMTKKKLEKR
jgi:hypothetical protein